MVDVVEIIYQSSRFACDGLWSGTEDRNHQHFVAIIPETRYVGDDVESPQEYAAREISDAKKRKRKSEKREQKRREEIEAEEQIHHQRWMSAKTEQERKRLNAERFYRHEYDGSDRFTTTQILLDMIARGEFDHLKTATVARLRK